MNVKSMSLILAASMLAVTLTGCVDAVGQGAADGVREGLTAVLASFIESLFPTFGAGG
jgi:hypothetical protein